MGDTPLASLSLTHVHYYPGDPISYVCAWLALVPQGLVITYVSLIWASREVEVLLMFAGQMGCECLNFILKRLIKEERPKEMLLYGKGYGMPSSHAQFLSYFAVYLSLFLMVRHKPTYQPSRNESNPFGTLISPFLQSLIVAVAALTVAIGVASSRVYLSYHTPKQVLVGCAAGVITAAAWFAVLSLARSYGVIDFLLETRLAKSVRMRDLLVEEDFVEAGWRHWQRVRSVGSAAGESRKSQ